MNTFDLIGLTEKEVIDILQKEKKRYRIVSKDGIPYIVTADMVNNRLNLTIENNIVTQINLG